MVTGCLKSSKRITKTKYTQITPEIMAKMKPLNISCIRSMSPELILLTPLGRCCMMGNLRISLSNSLRLRPCKSILKVTIRLRSVRLMLIGPFPNVISAMPAMLASGTVPLLPFTRKLPNALNV